MASPTASSSSLKSGLTGGAATGLGVDFQTRYAVLLALKLILRLFTECPTHRPLLSIEPRLLPEDSAAESQLTRWDMQVSPDLLAVEAKANLSKPDILEFLERCRRGLVPRHHQTFELIYGQCNVGFLHAVEKLLRLSVEAGEDSARFDALCALESNAQLMEVLGQLSMHAFSIAKRIKLKHAPEHQLTDDIELQLQFLVHPSQRRPLFNELWTLFSQAMKSRTPFFIPHLIDTLESLGFEFLERRCIEPTNLSPWLHKAIYFLQQCSVPVPTEVLSRICGVASEELHSQFESQNLAGINSDECWTLRPLPTEIGHPEHVSILLDGLHSLLDFIRSNRSNKLALLQVPNAVGFARLCSDCCPDAAAMAFEPLDKLLKRSGQKRLVLEVAQITVESARKVDSPNEDVRKAEAKALICGYAWVYQRIGQFDQAEQVAAESLRIGENLGWNRNTAFCLKCIGRLRRVRAEQESNGRTATKLLGESREHLLMAIERFSSSPEYGPTHEEVGDCYSLLARTYLQSKRTKEAEDCAKAARELITGKPGYHDSKEYMDLLMLEGDLLAEKLNFPAAVQRFTEAISCLSSNNAEKSEIAARGHFALGKVMLNWKQDKAAARIEIQLARDIWERLDERFYKGLAEWTLIELSGTISRREQITLNLKKELPSVRVELARLMDLARQPSGSNTLSQRDELNERVLAELLKQARKSDAVAKRSW